MTYKMIGTPMIGVMALIGMTPILEGSTLKSVHSSEINAPQSIVAGMRIT